jgi:hypothetical protein
VGLRIIKPARILYPGDLRTYHIVMAKNGEWIYPEEHNLSGPVLWYLVKNDKYGNHLAINELGSGPSIPLKIPPNSENFEIMAVYRAGDIAFSSITTLNTPLESPGTAYPENTGESE